LSGEETVFNLKKNKKFMNEILTTAASCFVTTLFGLGIGFAFLKVQK
jgi:hypothetical protein